MGKLTIQKLEDLCTFYIARNIQHFLKQEEEKKKLKVGEERKKKNFG